uniref:Uncharacterized protein n=1 Tax=Coccidioides posadasii RMSCC 3488 TaxID=454284 RepID=A0A0J6F9L9_COCPO|nr:hypothetical protein CPAG_02306 [Coccidioides posadasii RMSCC 3488]
MGSADDGKWREQLFTPHSPSSSARSLKWHLNMSKAFPCPPGWVWGNHSLTPCSSGFHSNFSQGVSMLQNPSVDSVNEEEPSALDVSNPACWARTSPLENLFQLAFKAASDREMESAIPRLLGPIRRPRRVQTDLQTLSPCYMHTQLL